MKKKIRIALVGAGAMGGALLRGWLNTGIIDAERSCLFDLALSSDMHGLATANGMSVNPAIGDVDVDVLIIAIKPQMARAVLPEFSTIAASAVVVSVMAGTSVETLAAVLGGAPKLSRVMPNLPASIGKGASGIFATDAVTSDERAMIDYLVSAAGSNIWVDREEAIDFVTAVSGSGPAYFFLLTEALSEAGTALGLSQSDAEKLARATAIGAGGVLETDERSAAALREAVTSPGGTTQAALEVFDGDEKALRRLTKKAVEEAAKRARELQS